MSDEATEALANLELSRELYSEAQRNQFYIDYQQSLENERLAEQNYDNHWKTNPTGWKFWKRAPASWDEELRRLMKFYRDANHAKQKVEAAHPLLVKIYWFKYQPVE